MIGKVVKDSEIMILFQKSNREIAGRYTHDGRVFKKVWTF